MALTDSELVATATNDSKTTSANNMVFHYLLQERTQLLQVPNSGAGIGPISSDHLLICEIMRINATKGESVNIYEDLSELVCVNEN